MNIKHAQLVLAHLERTEQRTSIARLADDAPIPRPESWAGRAAPRIAYIDDTPAMLRAHAAIEALARTTAVDVLKQRAHLYALHPNELEAIARQLSRASPSTLVTYLEWVMTVLRRTKQPRWVGFGGEVPAIALRGAMLYARYLRAKASQVAGLRLGQRRKALAMTQFHEIRRRYDLTAEDVGLLHDDIAPEG